MEAGLFLPQDGPENSLISKLLFHQVYFYCPLEASSHHEVRYV